MPAAARSSWPKPAAGDSHVPSRDHRCAAFSPPAPLSPEKQARLCLTPAHTGLRHLPRSTPPERLGRRAGPERPAGAWRATTSVIEDPGASAPAALAHCSTGGRWPAIPAVILVTTCSPSRSRGFRGRWPPISPAGHCEPRAPAADIPAPKGDAVTPRATATTEPTQDGTSATTAAPPDAGGRASTSARTYESSQATR